MKVGNTVQFNSLRWVMEELRQLLTDVQRQFESYVEAQENVDVLDELIALLRQIHGTLSLIEIHGAALLSEEMELLLKALKAKEITNKDSAHEVFMRAVLKLPDYLDSLATGARDIPMLLLPLLNDMRAVRNASLLSENVLFFPDVSASTGVYNKSALSVNVDVDLQALAKKVRHTYQLGLLGWFKSVDTESALEKMQSVLVKLQRASRRDESGRLWWVAAAIVDSLLHSALESSVALKSLMGQVDRQIKVLMESGEDEFFSSVPDELVKNLLYYVARSDSATELITQVKNEFELNRFLPKASELAEAEKTFIGPNQELLRAVAQAIKEDVTQAKDVLDVYVHSDRNDVEKLKGISPLLTKIADTLGMLGLGNTRTRLLGQLGKLDKLLETNQSPNEDVLMSIAGALLSVDDDVELFVEKRDSGNAEQAQSSDREPTLVLTENQKVISAVVNEALRDLARVKDAFLSYITQEFNAKTIRQASEVLKEIRGAMFVSPLDLIGPILDGLQIYLHENVIKLEHVPEGIEQNLFADIVTNVECFLEAVAENRMDAELYLASGQEALDVLKSGKFEPAPETTTSTSLTGSVQTADMREIESDLESLAEELKHEQPSREHSGAVELSYADKTAAQPIERKDYENLQIIGEDSDEEILDIFIEEALEELGNLNELFPLWKQDSNNSEAVTTIRRSFHTLKGSGRLVGAALIGEFAWCMENMYNRVIDGTIKVNAEMHRLVEESISLLPQLIEQMRGDKRPIDNTFELMRKADMIASKSFDVESDEYTDHQLSESMPVSEVFEETSVVDVEGNQQAIQQSEDEDIVLASPAEAELSESIELSDLGVDDDRLGLSSDDVPSIDEDIVLQEDIELSGEDSPGESLNKTTAQRKAAVDPILLGIFTDESESHLQTVTQFISNARTSDQKRTTPDLLRALHTLNGSSKTGKFNIIAEVANLLEEYAKNLDQLSVQWKPGDLSLMEQCVNYIYNCIDHLKDHTSELTDEDNILLRLRERLENSEQELNELSGDETPEEPTSIFEEFDPELVDVFMSEGEELVEASAKTLQQWLDSGHEESYIAELMRQLHTLKGGARMASLGAIGDLSHTLESLFIAISGERVEVTQELEHLLQTSIDRLAEMLEQIKLYQVPQDAEDLLAMLEKARNGGLTEIESEPEFHSYASSVDQDEFVIATQSNVVPLQSNNQSNQVRAPAAGETEADSGFQGLSQQEQIRVRADKLDNLVNFAGEVNIYHSRLMQHVNDQGFNLNELEQTVLRLRNQLREMEIETEAQIASRYEREAENPDIEFDPLEMDRYSHMQQITRSLSESASDLDNIRETLMDLLRDSETVLQQQSRVSTELQDELLQTRMVKFEGLTTRMRRIVRQTARQLNKKVELYTEGAETEIDRSVQDRMLAPLEHMLRNAVFHGIELPDERTALGKPERGSIQISIERDGSYVVLRITDDGRGIDAERIRRKALSQGLITVNDDLSDQEVLRYILHKGFSTAEDVSQIAGRGVGMDVVDSEVKQLGGALSITSEMGKGTVFTIRLPLTLAINQALLVQTGEDIYAIPLTSIEGVARVTAQEIMDNIAGNKDEYEYAGQTYQMYYLGMLLGTGAPVSLSKDVLYPLLMVRSGEQHVALTIDAMVGRREIVVKPVGPQISSIAGFSGATILADGRVALILDINGLVRRDVVEIETTSHVSVEHTGKIQNELTVMVVDDSITIRKVTARILGRHRLRVMTAKDGMDAVEQLQESTPDLFLMDIEMPRMDGFELASHVRAEPRLQAVPIIMITSRTGQKHRDRAEQIGVDRYLGKPFQENELMDEVNELLNRKASA